MKRYTVLPAEGESFSGASSYTRTFDVRKYWNKIVRIDLMWYTSSGSFVFSSFAINDVNGIKITGSVPTNWGALNRWNVLISHTGATTNAHVYSESTSSVTVGVSLIDFSNFIITFGFASNTAGKMKAVIYTTEEDND